MTGSDEAAPPARGASAILSGLRGPRWPVPTTALFLGVALAYAAGSKLALELAESSGLQSVFFIPAGVTVAVLLRVPRRQWWAVLLAAAIAETTLDLSDGYSLSASLGFTVANVVEPLVGALLVEWLCAGPLDLARRRDVMAFVLGAGVVGPALGGAIGAVSDVLWDDAFWPTWWQWALGDALGVVIVGSAVLVWGSSPDRRSLASVWGVLLLGGSVVVTALAFLATDLPVTFVVVIGVVVAGVVFGSRAVAMSALAVAGSIALGLAIDAGELLSGLPNSTALVLIKAQLGLFTVAGLVVAAEAFEARLATREAAEARARAERYDLERREAAALARLDDVVYESEIRFRGTFENAGVGMAHVGPDGRWLRVNDRLCAILGYSREVMLASTFHSIVDPDELAADHESAMRLISGEVDNTTVEKQCRRADGTEVWTSITTSLARTASGEPDYFIMVLDDISARKAAEQALREREAAERHARERAEFVTVVIHELEAVGSLRARAARLAELLVSSVADYAAVEAPGETEPVLAIAHRDATMVETLRRLREHHRLDASDPSSLIRAAAGTEQLIPVITPQTRARFETTPEIAALLEHLGPRSHMAVPIDLGGDVPGALLLGLTDPSRSPFTPDDLAWIREVARRAGVVLAAAWLREEEHRISVRLQRSLLPERLGTHPEVSIAARYESASDLLEVGGDWYDVIHRPEGNIVVAVGDVMGHGLDAAATMGRLRAAFAAYTAHSDHPGRLLTDLDRFAHGPGDADFTTVCCAVLDPVTAELRYSSAGHPPIFVASTDGSVRSLDDGRSVPLCTMPVEDRPEASTTLAPGDLVVLYSDGLVERRNEPLSAGMARLERALRALQDRPVDEVCERLVAEVTEDAARGDDLVVLAMRFTPVPASRLWHVFPARPEELATVRATVRRWLGRRQIGGRVEAEVLIGVGEACANAVEHAYRNGATGDIEVEITEDVDGTLLARVRDHGSWRSVDGLRDESRGRGTAIMKAVSLEFERHTGPDGTVVTLRIAPEVMGVDR